MSIEHKPNADLKYSEKSREEISENAPPIHTESQKVRDSTEWPEISKLTLLI
jgi:hypothetical protein